MAFCPLPLFIRPRGLRSSYQPLLGDLGLDLVRAWSIDWITWEWTSFHDYIDDNLIRDTSACLMDVDSRHGHTIILLVTDSRSWHLISHLKPWFRHIIHYKVDIYWFTLGYLEAYPCFEVWATSRMVPLGDLFVVQGLGYVSSSSSGFTMTCCKSYSYFMYLWGLWGSIRILF